VLRGGDYRLKRKKVGKRDFSAEPNCDKPPKGGSGVGENCESTREEIGIGVSVSM